MRWATSDERRNSTTSSSARMNVALWQASWGYYLGNMVGFESTGFTPEGLAWARDHFVSHVRAAGAFPIVRAGRQPYGVLPVTSLDLWKPGAGAEVTLSRDAFLKDLLVGVRDKFWRSKLDQVARVGQRQAPPDPDADLADVMRSEAFSGSLSCAQPLRPSLPAASARVHRRGSAGDGIHRRRGRDLRRCLQRLAVPWRPRIAGGDLRRVELRPQVRRSCKAARCRRGSRSSPITSRRCSRSLASMPWSRRGRPPTRRPRARACCRRCLRHALLREIAEAAARVAARAPRGDVGVAAARCGAQRSGRQEARFRRRSSVSWTTKVAAITGDRTIREVIEDALRGIAVPAAAAELAALAESSREPQGACRGATARRCNC